MSAVTSNSENPIEHSKQDAVVIDVSQQPPPGYYLRLQRKQRLEALVFHRRKNVQYIRDVHLGNRFWLNCYHLTAQEIDKHMIPILGPRKILSLFQLGLGISKLLDLYDEGIEGNNAYNCAGYSSYSHLLNGSGFVKAVSQLLEEWEYSISGTAVQVIKMLEIL